MRRARPGNPGSSARRGWKLRPCNGARGSQEPCRLVFTAPPSTRCLMSGQSPLQGHRQRTHCSRGLSGGPHPARRCSSMHSRQLVDPLAPEPRRVSGRRIRSGGVFTQQTESPSDPRRLAGPCDPARERSSLGVPGARIALWNTRREGEPRMREPEEDGERAEQP